MSPTQLRLGPMLERVFAVAGLFLMTDAVLILLATGGEAQTLESTEGYGTFQASAALLYLLTMGLLLPRLGSLWSLCRRNLPLILLVLWAGASIVWSVDPALTARRFVAVTGTTLFALWLVLRFTPSQFLALLATAIGIAAVLSFLFAWMMPTLGVHGFDQHMGDWRGVFVHKNVMGRVMTIGALAFTVLGLRSRKQLPLAMLGSATCVALIAMSGSRTAWVAVAFVLLGLPVLWVIRARIVLLLPLAVTAIATLGVTLQWLALQSEFFFTLLGRDVTLSGRTLLWAVAGQHIAQRPVLGHGYRAFWSSEAGISNNIWSAIGWMPTHAHNSFIDLALELGGVGMALFFITLVAILVRSVARLRYSQDPLDLWYPAAICFLILISVSDVVFLNQNNVTWVIYVSMAAYLNQPGQESRRAVSATSPRALSLATAV